MTLVPDTWGSNLNPASKTFKIAKVLSATPNTSGVAVTNTENFFTKDCPFPVEVVGVQAIMRTITTASHNETGGSVTVIVQASQEVDSSPAAPTSPSWDTLVASEECRADAVDEMCFDAPGDGTKVLDQSFVAIPEGGSLRATLSAQVEDAHSPADSLVEILIIVECRPTELKDRRYF